ncbi:hypothetical protein [Candidatus Phytoplasma tritici]|uniref:hypothetical protein n=1 Tax=Candidatus Phytoplasma tritici TaxID=321961 RepID=UPI001F11F854|nr:hypothetical protein [Candidatus Phytoplasma tritici]
MKELLVLLKEIPNILDNLVLLTSVGGFTSIASVAGLTRIISIMVNAVPVVTSAVKDVSSLIAEVTQRTLKNNVDILLNVINFYF